MVKCTLVVTFHVHPRCCCPILIEFVFQRTTHTQYIKHHHQIDPMCSRCVFPVRSLTNVNITFVVELSDNKRVLEMSNIDSYMFVLPVIGKHVLNFLRFC